MSNPRHPAPPGTLVLPVADAARAAAFYRDLFGLDSLSDEAGTELLWPGRRGPQTRVLLRVVSRVEPLRLGVELGSAAEVLDLYLLAQLLGASAVPPRADAARTSFVVTDPDGHTVAIYAATRHAARRLHRPGADRRGGRQSGDARDRDRSGHEAPRQILHRHRTSG